MLARILLAAIGATLIFVTLNDVFQSVIVPRAPAFVGRPSRWLWRVAWRVWPRVIALDPDPLRREDALATFAPLMLVAQLLLWSALLVVGFGLLLALDSVHVRPHMTNVWQSFYFAATAFFTIGFGDFVGGDGWTRFVSVAAGAAGFGVVSTTTAFLFAVFASFQQREQFVVMIGARAGVPASGVALLVHAAQPDLQRGLPELMRDAQRWCALVMETHLAYPVLAYFRSSHDFESWAGTLGTLLDAATLMMTTVRCENGEARIFYEIGRHCVRDFSKFFGERVYTPDPGIAREEFDRACDKLAAAGYEMNDRDVAWSAFLELRSAYAGPLNHIARFFEIPPLQWIGDRSAVRSTHA